MSETIKYLEEKYSKNKNNMYLEEKLDLLIEQNLYIKSYMDLFLPDLTTEKGVIHFLEISRNTFIKYIREEIFINGIHYTMEENRKIFNSNEIINFKKSGQVGRKRKDTTKETLELINQKLGIFNISKSA